MVSSKEKPRHLGRGLESLLGPITSAVSGASREVNAAEQEHKFPPDKQLQTNLAEIPVASIQPNPYQVRQVWDEDELAALAESIRANGVVQPVIVRSAGSGYELVAGERRLRAAKLAGLETIPAVVRQASDEELLELALVENIHRSDLNPIERAQAYQSYIRRFSLTQTEAAQRLGEDRSVIANYLRLLDLPGEIQRMVIRGELTMGHARAILGVPTDDLRRRLANRALAGRLNVRQVENLVRRYNSGQHQGPTAGAAKPPHVREMEKNLAAQLGTKVSIETRKNGQRGKIIIDFRSLDEFDRIVEKMGLSSLEQV